VAGQTDIFCAVALGFPKAIVMKPSAKELAILKALAEEQRFHLEAYDVVESLGVHETKLCRITNISLDELIRPRTRKKRGVKSRYGLIVHLANNHLIGITRGWNGERFGYAWLTEEGKRVARIKGLL
jgi:hypothetical protein